MTRKRMEKGYSTATLVKRLEAIRSEVNEMGVDGRLPGDKSLEVAVLIARATAIVVKG